MSDPSTESPAREQAPLVLPAWAIGVPAVLLLGFLGLLGRAGVGIQVIGLPLGAYLTPLPSLLVLGLIRTARGRLLLRSFDRSQRRVAIAVAVAVAVGLLRAAVQGMPTLLRFQDMAYLLHLPWIVLGMAAMKTLASGEERTRVLRWLAGTFAVILTLHWSRGVIVPVEGLFEWLIGSLERVSDKPHRLLKAGDRTMFGIALGALALGLSDRVTVAGASLVIAAGTLIGTDLGGNFLGGSRGALLGGAAGSFFLLAGRLLNRRARLLLAMGFALGLSFALFPIVTEPGTTAEPPTITERYADAPITSQPGTTAELPTITKRYAELAGPRSLSATMEQYDNLTGNVGWRLQIWNEVIEEWNASWSNRLFGIGFGNDIAAMTVPGRQGFDGANRGVHNILLTIAARQGLLGLTAAAGVFLTLALANPWSRSVVLPLFFGSLVIGLFDVFLEGVQAPVFLWSMIGMLLAWSADEPRTLSPRP